MSLHGAISGGLREKEKKFHCRKKILKRRFIMKHLLTLVNMEMNEWESIIETGLKYWNQKDNELSLKEKIVGVYFSKTSTRTRTSFITAAIRLGANVVSYGKGDLQTNTGESFLDTGEMLALYLDALVARTNDPVSEMDDLAAQNKMSVINAMSKEEHPTQAISDFITIRRIFGSFNGLHMVYAGEGNNTAVALLHAVSMTPGFRLTLATPKAYCIDQNLVDLAVKRARQNGSEIEQIHSLDKLKNTADIVYTTRWETMGVSHTGDWKKEFYPFGITTDLFSRLAKNENSIFMHDLPASRGNEVVSEVLDSKYSRVIMQAKGKLYGAMASLNFVIKSTL